MRLHVVSLPHTQTTHAFDWCAYTAKVRRLPQMIRPLGHEVVLYAGVENEAEVDEFVTIVRPHDQQEWFGGVWSRDNVFDHWDPEHACWREMNNQAIYEIRKRIRPGDAIAIIAGRCQAAIADAFPDHIAIEWGVGYVGVLPQSFRAFESRAHQHYVAGWHRDDTGRFFDTVIPNAFDPTDYILDCGGDYLLYLGRMTPRKGLSVVAELAKDYKVVTAGQGDDRVPGAEHVGVVLGREKAELLAGARAVLVPSLYLEPFGGVAVEAMMSGTPAITTDWGAFPETVEHDVSGFRCRTLSEFREAVECADLLSPLDIRRHAVEHFSTLAVQDRYALWLQQLALLDGVGWYD